MSSRFANDSFIFGVGSSSLCTDFGIFGVGILSWMESMSDDTIANNLCNLFLRSCFCRARTFRLWSRFRVISKSAWLIRMFDLFIL